MRKLRIVFHDAGGGHRNAAEALKSSLEAERAWEVQLLNIQELLDSVDVVRKVTGLRVQEGYNLLLRKGWTRYTPQLLIALRGMIRAFHAPIVHTFRKHWEQHPADLVLSVIPHFNRALAESVRKTIPQTPFVTLITDFADYPPQFWIERESEYIICGTEKARQQAFAMGHSPLRVFETSGMILKPSFYHKPAINRVAEREKIGLDPALPVGVVLFGGHGSSAMLDIATKLDESPDALQLIMICGKNEKLKNELENLKTRKKMLPLGFTKKVDYYMSLADFFIGKPGPGSISEALQFDLPVIVERNAWTMPQERYNTQWVKEKHVGIVLSSFRNIASGVSQLLEPATFQELQNNAKAYSNRALFEVPVILEHVWEKHVPDSMPVSSPLTGVGMFEQGEAWAGST